MARTMTVYHVRYFDGVDHHEEFLDQDDAHDYAQSAYVRGVYPVEMFARERELTTHKPVEAEGPDLGF